ncbi:hypothetical protein HanPI659440_Chr04g0173901 [Helianthus annuus]|nr:hypothetical protein HanPI659440_Chr04g0173901 [Helianthus annuus]
MKRDFYFLEIDQTPNDEKGVRDTSSASDSQQPGTSHRIVETVDAQQSTTSLDRAKQQHHTVSGDQPYCMDLLNEYGLSGCKPVSCPVEQHHIVSKVCVDNEAVLSNITEYQKLIGKPLRGHMKLALKVLRYLKKAPGLGVQLKQSDQFQLCAYIDSDWAKSHGGRRFVTGYCVFLGETLISWKSKTQSVVA